MPKNKDRGFMTHPRQEAPYRPVADRRQDYKAVEERLTDAELHQQAARCMDCGIPFCHAAQTGCSLGNVIPEFNELVFEERWREALEILHSTNCFPEFTGRICPAPCESACVLGINQPPVNICKIELAVIEKGFERGYVEPRPPQIRKPQAVAVLGSGPAGLAAADVLNRAGYPVTVFEEAAQPGGILRYGIPDFKLEKWVLERRLNLMRAEGVVFECNVTAGTDVSYRFLKERFGAVVLTGGAREPRELQAPGRELNGIHLAMDFLIQSNQRLNNEPFTGDPILAAGKRVLVIGGGDTGSDCIGTSWRQGAVAVTQLEILPKPPPERAPETPWPLWPRKLRTSSSHQEGGARHWAVETTAFRGDNQGRVRAVRCVELDWLADEASGRYQPMPKQGTEFEIEAELVLLALGFTGPGPNRLVEQIGLACDARGFIQRDENYMASVPGLFVAGDMWRGASLVVHAISDGMRTAEHVMRYLEA